MSFVLLIFFIFLPVVFLLHHLSRRKHWQNAVLLFASYAFYGWWDVRFCALLFASSAIDYALGWSIHASENPRLRRALLIVSLVLGLGILGFFKYFNFFVHSLAVALAGVGIDLEASPVHVLLPLGISFYTFQTLSYTLDIYRRKLEPHRDFLAYLTFVAFFPQLVAGPIERATRLLPQFHLARRFSQDQAREGCRLILWGLLKKLVIADNLAGIVDTAYAAPQTASGLELAVATGCFGFQIYCDFSAYSDMAAGLGGLFGIRLTRNFAYPYFSRSPSEFWHRWHISLSTWFRDYVFIPLGGSRGTPEQTTRNLFITSLLSGLWHGASWNFVVWGAWHGLLLAAARGLGWTSPSMGSDTSPGGQKLWPSLPTIARMAAVFLFVNAAWVFFRARDLPEALRILNRIATGLMNQESFQWMLQLAVPQLLVFGLLGLFVVAEWLARSRWSPLSMPSIPVAGRWFVYTLCVAVLLFFSAPETEEFVYFQF